MNGLYLDKFKNKIIGTQKIPARMALYADFPENLNNEVVEFLKGQGIEKLYCHQSKM